MNKENYEILGVPETATDAELKSAYEALKKKYNEDKWLDGEAGNEAARMLEKLETAYAEICSERREKTENGNSAAFEEVASLIRSGDIATAQQRLDSFNERNAEWHYLQSVVFYKKNWMNESKKQLEIAMQMDQNNPKYRDAYEKLRSRAEYANQTGNAPHTNPNVNQGDGQMGGSFCANCASFCYTYLCVSCLFNLCCNCR